MKIIIIIFVLVPFLHNGLFSQGIVTIPVSTKSHVLVLQTDKDSRLWITYFGKKIADSAEYASAVNQYYRNDNNSGLYNSVYTPAGTWSLSEPALQVMHDDGNPSLDLKFISYEVKKDSDDVSTTIIKLKDPVYNLNVSLFYKTWNDENVIEQWTEITNNEKGAVTLEKYASANLYFTSSLLIPS